MIWLKNLLPTTAMDCNSQIDLATCDSRFSAILVWYILAYVVILNIVVCIVPSMDSYIAIGHSGHRAGSSCSIAVDM